MNYLTMEQFDQWIAALRSGQYKKGRNVLKSVGVRDTTPAYCCLGVAQEIFNIETRSCSFLVDSEGVYQFLSPSLQSEIAVLNDGPDPTFKSVVERLNLWVREKRIPFGEPIRE